jgi:hypothetical protein
MQGADDLTYARHGAERFGSVLDRFQLRNIENAIAELPPDQAGIRLHGVPMLSPYLEASGPVGRIAAKILGAKCRPVRALLFDKTPATNWALGWHQDRTIVVKERVDVRGFGPWTVKQSLIHVEPPFELFARMVTVRLHLDHVSATNAPLLIAPGSHKLGRIPTIEVSDVVKGCGKTACLANRGDVWLYATPILHASEAAAEPGHRRVLQLDYAEGELPEGLRWLGV